MLKIAFGLFMSFPSAHLRAESMHCADVNSVVQEGIEYHLTGAGTTDLPIDCAKKRKWTYFDPSIEVKADPYSNPEYIWFDPKRDTYQLGKITAKPDATYTADVTFTIKGKKYPVTYIYAPNDLMQKHRGVCGTMTKPGKPWIFRVDCDIPRGKKGKKS